jgi:hypothetical protein
MMYVGEIRLLKSTMSMPVTRKTAAVTDHVPDASIGALIGGYRRKLIFRSESARFSLSLPDWKIALGWRRYSERC